jgi:hypothetical protein
MKTSKRLLLIFICLTAFGSCSKCTSGDGGLSTKDDPHAKYRTSWESYREAANTAVNELGLSVKEREVFYYLNLARINPRLFAETYAADYWSYVKGYAWNERKQSLIGELKSMAPLSPVMPDRAMQELASCFAYESGQRGISGHDRSETGCNDGYNAECCLYGGAQNGLSVVMDLLIDAGENNAALGHRRICLRNESYGMGVAIRPHTQYGFNAVLDFRKK